jgi:hypothetical protein
MELPQAVPSYSWLPETCRVVILIKLEFSVSVGFIHKESVTMHGHTIVKHSGNSLSIILESLTTTYLYVSLFVIMTLCEGIFNSCGMVFLERFNRMFTCHLRDYRV